MPPVPEPRAAGRAKLTLPRRALLPKPDAGDPVDYYYRLPTARLYRARLKLALTLLGSQTYDSMLEVGYGSGIFLPQLSLHSRRLAAVDIHDEGESVRRMLAELGLSADI